MVQIDDVEKTKITEDDMVRDSLNVTLQSKKHFTKKSTSIGAIDASNSLNKLDVIVGGGAGKNYQK